MKRAALLAACALYVLFVMRTSWVSDDAFITLRVVDNTVHGFGPRWNVAERVQVFTHPLWFLVLTPVYALTREAYLTATALCWIASFAGIGVVAARLGRCDPAMAAVAIAALSLSRAFVDYSTSGLENPLTHLLLVLFAFAVFDEAPWTDRRVLHAAVVAGLLTLNRMDALLFVAPVLLTVLATERRARAVSAAAFGFAPFVAWEVFATVYYGSPWPNTALAKLNTGIPAGELFSQGAHYLADALRNDPVTPALAFGGIAAALLRRRRLEIALAGGVALALLYVVKVGGDFMAGRFLTAPALVGSLLLARAGVDAGRTARRAVSLAALTLGVVGVAPALGAGQAYASRAMDLLRPHGIADERRFYFATAGLFNGVPGWTRPMASNRWVNKAVDLRRTGPRIAVEGAIGYVGFFAGPSVHIVDYHALGDPFLARLPMVTSDPVYAAFLQRVRPGESAAAWRIGHFLRAVPRGYLASLATGENQLADPTLRRLWERILRVSRGPVFTGARFRDIAALLAGGGAPRERPPFVEIAWTELVDADPQNAEATFQAALGAGRTPKGAALLEETLRRAPDHQRAMVQLAELVLDDGDLPRAEELLRRARALAPLDPGAVGVEGDLARVRGEADRAKALYLETARLDPMIAGRMYGNIGIVYGLQGNWIAALDWFARAEEVSPGDPLTVYNTGLAYARMGRISDARAAFQRALAIDPRYEPALRALRALSGS